METTYGLVSYWKMKGLLKWAMCWRCFKEPNYLCGAHISNSMATASRVAQCIRQHQSQIPSTLAFTNAARSNHNYRRALVIVPLCFSNLRFFLRNTGVRKGTSYDVWMIQKKLRVSDRLLGSIRHGYYWWTVAYILCFDFCSLRHGTSFYARLLIDCSWTHGQRNLSISVH